MTSSGMPQRAAHAERKHSTLSSSRPFNAPPDFHLHSAINRKDAASRGGVTQPERYYATLCPFNPLMESPSTEAGRLNHSTLKESGHQPNARHQPPRIQLRQRQVLRMKAALFAVGCMALLDAATNASHLFSFDSMCQHHERYQEYQNALEI